MLPFAPTAGTEMSANRFDPVRRIFPEPHYAPFKIFFSLFPDLNINNITRYKHWHKDNLSLYSGKGIPFRTNIGDQNIVKHRQFLSSAHYTKFWPYGFMNLLIPDVNQE
jgi:hypothetical protein